MKKILLCLALAMGITMASCQKEDDINIIDSVTDTTPETSCIDLNVNLEGTWMPTDETHFKVLFYYRDNGELMDSIVSDMGEDGFTFDAQGNANATPWNLPAVCTVDSAQIHFDIMGIVTFDFDLIQLTQDHMTFQRVKTSEYTTSEDGVEITVDGVETEYWDLKRN